jgi:tetratricopeptide (TPR) repeat protein
MKRLSKIVPLLVVAILVAAPLYAQQNASLSGKVTGRDGTTPAQGIEVQIDSMVTNNGRLQVRDRLNTRTGRNGEFSMSGLYPGRVIVTIFENKQPVMVKGERVGDEIFLASGIDQRVTFDLSKAPAPAPAAAAGAAPTAASNLSAADREALRKKLEEEAAAAGVMNAAFEAGKAAFTAKDYPESVKQFRTAAEKAPVPSDIIWANLGRALDANKEYEEAEKAYAKAIELKPTESNYFLNLSLVQISNNKLDAATSSIEKAAALNPANGGLAYYNLGATLINRNKPKEAVTFLKKAVELDPKYVNAYYQLGLSLVGLGEMGEAATYLQKVVELAPTSPDAATAKALIDATKTQGTTSFQSPEAKAKADAEAAAKNKQQGKTKN